jgi:hypothetical protein
MLGFVLMEQKNSRVEPTKQRDQTTNVRSNPVNSLEDKAAQQVPVDSALENKLARTRLKVSNEPANIGTALSTTSAGLDAAATQLPARYSV